MKKSLIALAVMAAAGAASAQSSVTLFGIVDVTIHRASQQGGTNNTVMTHSGYNSSRLGFRGTEDLGGGMAASFWLEGALSNDDGTVGKFDFRRRSTLSLSGGFGELRLGRDYTPTFYNGSVFDPFGTNGVGSQIMHKIKTQTTAAFAGEPTISTFDPNYVRSDNMVSYFLPPNLGGFYGQVSYAFDERAGNAGSDQGRYVGARLGFGSGPFNVAAAYGRTEGSATPTFVAGGAPDTRVWNVGGQWDFGVARLMGFYDRTEFEGDGEEADMKTWLIGTLVPVGAGEIRASYSRSKFEDDDRADQIAIGYVHNLSKRTAVYTTFAQVRNRGDVAVTVGHSSVPGVAGRRGRGFDLGIRHSF